MNEEMVLAIVKATRLTLRMAEDMQNLMASKTKDTVADQVAGYLGDVLFDLLGEDPETCENFEETETMKLLKSEMPDEDVAKEFMVKQPKPNLDRPDMRTSFAANGGYLYMDKRGIEVGSNGERPAKVYERLNKVTAILKNCEEENSRMRVIINQVSEQQCNSCWRRQYDMCEGEQCRWFRFRKGDFT